MNARASAFRRGIAPWLRALGLGTALGVAIAGAARAGVWSALAALGGELSARVSPFWLPMLALALRVLWLWAQALRTRLGAVTPGRPVRSELATLARIFPVLGVLGALWQLDRALDRAVSIPRLLELWSAFVPVLLGIALQLATRRSSAHARIWSLARVTPSGERELYRLDHALLGEGEAGLAALLRALESRAPDALHLDLDALLPQERRSALHARIADSIDGPVQLTPPLPGMLAPRWSEVLGAVLPGSQPRPGIA
jgi:hypothetical protein